jgi:formylglycine-generating enzyme required for sulfatase activity
MTMPAGCATTPSAPTQQDYTETIRGTTVTFDMVWIPAGGFWMGRTEVTWNEFLLYCGFDAQEDVPPDADAVSKPSKPLAGNPYDRDWGAGARPAVGASWNAAKKYAAWLSINTGHAYRLPTEAEWELACGSGHEPIETHAWVAENSDGMTHEVGGKAPNAYGLHDMLGNLWEYCANPYAPDQPKRAVLRGGSWRDPAAETSVERRLRFDNDWVLADPNVPAGVWWVPDGDHLGFRLVRSGPDHHDGEGSDGDSHGTNEP